MLLLLPSDNTNSSSLHLVYMKQHEDHAVCMNESDLPAYAFTIDYTTQVGDESGPYFKIAVSADGNSDMGCSGSFTLAREKDERTC